VRAVPTSDAVTIELIVVDQSAGPETRQRLAALADDRLRCIRGTCDGKPFGLNEGLLLAHSPIVVMTDDDCEPPPDWVAGMAMILATSPRVALVFSNVVAPPYDRTLGYVPSYERTSDRVVRSIGATCWGRGLGAGMAVRREVVLATAVR
jgi:glycosyltransferase involved in cell wall biosynthesis